MEKGMNEAAKLRSAAQTIARQRILTILLLKPVYHGKTLLFPDGIGLTATAWNPDSGEIALSWVDDGLEVEEQTLWLPPSLWTVPSDKTAKPLPGRIQVRAGYTKPLKSK